MKITRGDIRSIIREMLLKEDRADRLTLWLKVEGDKLVLHVNESGMVYNLFDYTEAAKQKGGLYGLERQFELDHGMEMPPGAMVIDYDGVGMGDLPIEEAFEWVAEQYAEWEMNATATHAADLEDFLSSGASDYEDEI